MKPILFFSILSVIIFSSCNYVIGKIGNGHIIKQNRSVGSFTAVEANGAVNVYLRQDSNHSVTIEADENLQDYILVYDEGDDIVITTKKGRNIRPSRKIKVYITSPEFRQVKVSGAVNIYGQNKITGTESISFRSSGASEIKLELNVPQITVDVTGAGEVNLKGETRDFDIESSGASEINCYDLLAENTKVRISGAGDAEVHASVKLDVRVSGAGSVKYKGNATVSEKISGAGSVKKVD